jgi:hypothetical protein
MIREFRGIHSTLTLNSETGMSKPSKFKRGRTGTAPLALSLVDRLPTTLIETLEQVLTKDAISSKKWGRINADYRHTAAFASTCKAMNLSRRRADIDRFVILNEERARYIVEGSGRYHFVNVTVSNRRVMKALMDASSLRANKVGIRELCMHYVLCEADKCVIGVGDRLGCTTLSLSFKYNTMRLPSFRGNSELRHLVIREYMGIDLSSLESLQGLYCLYLESCLFLTDLQVLEKLPVLKILKLKRCVDVVTSKFRSDNPFLDIEVDDS